MEANTLSGSSARPGGSAGFSRKRSTVSPSEPGVITPNEDDSVRGTLIPATVTPAPLSMCWLSIWRGSMRYTWSAPNTATYSGRSS